MHRTTSLVLPFGLSAAILALDQATKAAVVALVPAGTIGWSALGDFFWLVHAKNLGIAFSVGDGLGPLLRVGLFIVLPLALLAGVLVFYFRSREIDGFQRWVLAGIVGGGLGNQVDRIFRPEGVVDFLSFKFWGILGMERFPTFNIADSSLVVCAFLLAISTFVADARRKP